MNTVPHMLHTLIVFRSCLDGRAAYLFGYDLLMCAAVTTNCCKLLSELQVFP